MKSWTARNVTMFPTQHVALIPSDSAEFNQPTAIMVLNTGNVAIADKYNNVINYVGVPAFTVIPVMARKLMATGTTARGQLATPVNSAFTQTDTGGSLTPSTTYYYRVSAIDGVGESLASAETSGATSATAGNTHAMVVNWGAVTGATGYKIYGRTTGAEQLIATVGAVTTYTDTGSITPSGALPTANTSSTGFIGLYGYQ